jgi:hypothetical protein
VAVGPDIRSDERLWVCQVRIEGQQQRGAFLDKANPGVPVAVNATLVSFGVSEPPFEVEVVLRQVTLLASHKQPRRKARHHAAHVLPHGISALLELLLHTLKLPLTLGTRATRRLDCRLDSPDILHMGAQSFVDVMDGRQPAVNVGR